MKEYRIDDEHHENKSDPYTLEEDVQIWEFLHRFAYDSEEGIAEKFRGTSPHANIFWKKFVNEMNSHREPNNLRRHFSKLSKSLHKMPFGTEIKLNLYYSLDITVPQEFIEDAWRFARIWISKEGLVSAFEMKTDDEVRRDCEEEASINAELMRREMEKLQKEEVEIRKERNRLRREELKAKKDAEVVQATLGFIVDSVVEAEIVAAAKAAAEKKKKKATPKKRRRSQAPKQNTPIGPPPSIQTPPETPPAKKARLMFSEEDDVKMWMYLYAKLRVIDFQENEQKLKPTSVKLWREFLGDSTDKHLENALCHHYSSMSNHLHKMPLDMPTKTKLYYGLHIPVESGFLERLRKVTEVEVDEHGYILDYSAFHCIEEKIVTPRKEDVCRTSRLSMY